MVTIKLDLRYLFNQIILSSSSPSRPCEMLTQFRFPCSKNVILMEGFGPGNFNSHMTKHSRRQKCAQLELHTHHIVDNSHTLFICFALADCCFDIKQLPKMCLTFMCWQCSRPIESTMYYSSLLPLSVLNTLIHTILIEVHMRVEVCFYTGFH